MKQAILITAYKNFQHLIDIIDFFDDDFRFYIHVDKKVKIPFNFTEKINRIPGVELLSQKYKTNWGGFNHLKAILYLSKEALKRKENNYFLLISGQDFPVEKLESFKSYFGRNRDWNFLNYHQMPHYDWSSEGGFERLEYYRFYDLMNYKNERQRYRIRRIVNFQKNINFKRSLPKNFPKLFGGSTWWSLNRECLQYVEDFGNRNKKFLTRFKYTFCPEEFYYSTVLMNSPFAENIKNDNKRYILWKVQYGSNPAILDMNNFVDITNSTNFFARKFDRKISNELLAKLKSEILNE